MGKRLIKTRLHVEADSAFLEVYRMCKALERRQHANAKLSASNARLRINASSVGIYLALGQWEVAYHQALLTLDLLEKPRYSSSSVEEYQRFVGRLGQLVEQGRITPERRCELHWPTFE